MVVNTSRQKLADVLKAELEAGRGVDIAVDCLGDAPVGECLPYMNVGGRWIMIATLAGDFANIDLRSMYVRRTQLIGTTLRSRTPEQKADILGRMVQEIWPMLENDSIRPAIYKVLPIQEAEEAQALMASGRHVGKIVLKVR
jgi:NADPH2:quinone reductase